MITSEAYALFIQRETRHKTNVFKSKELEKRRRSTICKLAQVISQKIIVMVSWSDLHIFYQSKKKKRVSCVWNPAIINSAKL
jgi:hypothetical protein